MEGRQNDVDGGEEMDAKNHVCCEHNASLVFIWLCPENRNKF